MEKALMVLLVVASGNVVFSSNSTRTPKLEILRSPTKVAIWKPDPYPVVRSYGDLLQPTGEKNFTDISLPSRNITETLSSSNATEGNSTQIENEIIEDLSRNSTDSNILEVTEMPEVFTGNTTCIRRDYDNEIAAVFRNETGPIEAASLVFNATMEPPEAIGNVTEFVGLQVLNETFVDCDVYFKT